MKVLITALLWLVMAEVVADKISVPAVLNTPVQASQVAQVDSGVAAQSAPTPDIICPRDSEFKTENKTGVREVWCETQYQEHSAVHGPYKAWLANGQLIAEGNYENGHMVGTWQYWGIDGRFQGALIYQEGEMVSAAISRRK